MHLIRLAPLEITESEVHVSWTVEPEIVLYKQTHFALDFGDALDPRALPLKLWWMIVLMILHSHWNLLRPCRVSLPVALAESEIEFWQRLLDNERVALEFFRGTTDFERNIELVASGTGAEEIKAPLDANRFAMCYSGGKESLLQAGLLCEFTARPLLVSVYSPLPPLNDQDSQWFDWSRREIVKRRDCEVVEVQSNLRGIWANGFSRALGYRHAVNEMSDTFLYSGALLAVAFAKGIREVYIAAEFFSNKVPFYQGRVTPDFFFMYDTITLAALNSRFSRFGLCYGSLILPLSHFQVLELLHTCYPELGALEISCWEVPDRTQRYCNECQKCLRVALSLLALGKDPAQIGLDLPRLFRARRAWPLEPSPLSSRYGEYAASRINLRDVRPFLPGPTWRERLTCRRAEAHEILERFVELAVPLAEPFYGQYRREYMKYVPARLRDALDQVYSKQWEVDPLDRTADLAALDQTINWITVPLDQTA